MLKPTVQTLLYIFLYALVSVVWYPSANAQTPIYEGVYSEMHETPPLNRTKLVALTATQTPFRETAGKKGQPLSNVGIFDSDPAFVSASPHPLLEGFGPAEKSQTLRLANAGDADALYKLGLSSLYGVNSTQNQRVAERFFFYAAEKGNQDAKRYLASIQPVNEPTTQIKSSKVVKHTPFNGVKENVIAEATTTISPVIKEDVLVADIPAVQDVVEPETSIKVADGVIPLRVTPATDQRIYNSGSTDDGSTYVSKPQSRWVYLIYFALLITVLLVSLYAFFFIRHSVKTKKDLPEGFDKKVYLDLNPDVKMAKADAAYHYISHGRYEGRPYRY